MVSLREGEITLKYYDKNPAMREGKPGGMGFTLPREKNSSALKQSLGKEYFSGKDYWVPLSQTRIATPLIPKYGLQADPKLTSRNSLIHEVVEFLIKKMIQEEFCAKFNLQRHSYLVKLNNFCVSPR